MRLNAVNITSDHQIRAGGARSLTEPSTGATQTVASTAASTRYGEPQLLQTFKSNRWRDNEFVVYQVQNRATGNWEVRASSLRDNRRNPDLLVYTSKRPVIAADFNRTGPLLPKLSETIQALNAPANVLPSEGRANTGNAWDFLVGAGSSVLFSLPRDIVGIPERLGRNVGLLGGNLRALAERGFDFFHPADLSRDGFSNPIREEQRNQFAETNHSAEAVANLQRAFAQALGAEPTSFGFKAGDLVGPFLLLAASAARGARAGGGQPGLSRQGPDQALRGEFRTRVQTASLDELARGVNALSREQATRLRTQFPDEYRALTNRLAQFNNPQAASLLARLRGEGIVATGTSGTSGTSGSAATPPRNVTPTESTPTPSSSAIVPTGTPTVPTTVPRTPPVETLIDRFLRNRPDMEASALRPFVQKRVADQTPDEAMRTLNDLANNPAAVQALYTEAALAQANSAAASMRVNGKAPRLYQPGQEQAATAEAFAANRAGDAARAANRPGEVSLAFKIRTDAGVEVPAVFTGSPAEASALLRSPAFTQPSTGGQSRAYVPEGFAREGGRTPDTIHALANWRPTTPTNSAATTGGNNIPVTGAPPNAEPRMQLSGRATETAAAAQVVPITIMRGKDGSISGVAPSGSSAASDPIGLVVKHAAEQIAESPVLVRISQGQLTPQHWHAWASQRYYLAQGLFQNLLEASIEAATKLRDGFTAGSADWQAANELVENLKLNLKDELGNWPNPDAQYGLAPHDTWRQNAYQALAEELHPHGLSDPRRSAPESVGEGERISDIFANRVREVIAKAQARNATPEDCYRLIALFAGVEASIPAEYSRVLPGLARDFPGSFGDSNADIRLPEWVRAIRNWNRMYFADHIIHDTQHHLPGITEPLKRLLASKPNLRGIVVKEIEAITQAKILFYEKLGAQTGIGQPHSP